MKKQHTFLQRLFFAVCAIAVPGSLAAQDRSQADSQQHVAKGPEQRRAIPVLLRHEDTAPDQKLASLLESLSKRHAGNMTRERLPDVIRAAGEDWRLDVFGDGSGAEFLDQAAADRSHHFGVEPSKAMSTRALASAGRAYVERYLAKVIVLQPGERLVPVATSFRTEGGIGRDGSNAYSAIVANRVIFGREIDGIPVVGAGSKVTITFLNDGTVESFRYDWPVYSHTGRVQQLAPSREILQRIRRVAAARTKTDLSGPIAESGDIESMSKPLPLSDRVHLQDVKCGYYDPGYRNRDPRAPVQAGCYYHVLHTGGSGEYITTAGYSGAVPSAEKPEPDYRWPEANVLSGEVVKGPLAPCDSGPAE